MGRQCSFNSFSAFLCAQSSDIHEWNTENVNHITEGDKMYVDSFQARMIPDLDAISLNYLPNHGRWFTPKIKLTT